MNHRNRQYLNDAITASGSFHNRCGPASFYLDRRHVLHCYNQSAYCIWNTANLKPRYK